MIFGGDSRVLMQFNNDALDVYYILEIVNSARTRVDFGAPLVIELPPGANGAMIRTGLAGQDCANAPLAKAVNARKRKKRFMAAIL